MLTDTRNSKYAKVTQLPWNAVKWTKGFWADTEKMCADGMVPQLKYMFDSKDISHVVENFKICAGEAEGDFDGTVFGDGDFYKWMESAIYMAAKTGNEKLLDEIDSYIELIGRAQQEDGYLSTKQIIGERLGNGISRMGDVNDFEVYNFGHMFTAACLHKRVTGKDNFLNIAIKTADYLKNLYEEAARTGEVQTAVCPSHYMGLVEMYRTTGDGKYLKLAKMAIELRDSVKDGTDDNQDRLPLKQHEKIVGHAVRANYLYAGVADLLSEEWDEDYAEVLDKMWESLNAHKIYITGGCGALYNGVSPYGNFFVDQKIHQAYGYEYQLPNITAYNETCASIGLVMWAVRMFNIKPEAKYFDMIERAMLNVNMAAVSLDGKRYFYENMLRRTKKLEYEMIWPLTRSEYILSYCCPPNLARLLSQASEYAYSVSDNAVWMGMYGASEADLKLSGGADFTMKQTTGYPYDGKIVLEALEVRCDAPMEIRVRIPGWAEKGTITLPDGSQKEITPADAGTYYTIPVQKLEGMRIVIDFDMPARYTVANPMVEEDNCQVAVERGPLVYCMETPDTDVDTLDDLMFASNAVFEPVPFEIQGRSMTALEGKALCLKRDRYDRNALYQKFRYCGAEEKDVRLIPYFAWDNREFGEMRIWMPVMYRD